MKLYKVTGKYHGKKVVRAGIESEYQNKIKIELWHEEQDFESIPLGKEHFTFTHLIFDDKLGYLRILFGRRPASIARKYINQLGLKIEKAII